MTEAAKRIDRNRHAGTLPRPGTISLSGRVMHPLLAYLAARGHDRSAFLKSQGLDLTLLRDPEARLPHPVAGRLWHAASQITQDPNLGIHVAEGIQLEDFGALGYALRTSENLGMSLDRLCRYHRFLHDVAEVRLSVHRHQAILSHHLPLPAALPRPVSEFVVAAWLVTSRQATGVHWSPIEVRFPHSAPDDASEIHRFFGCSLRFRHDRNEMVFSRDLLDTPFLNADPALRGILEAQVVATLQKLPKGEAATDAVRRCLAAELCNGEPSLRQIAPRLHMSPRTLHRRLDNEGTSFRGVLTEVRRELAVRHLTEHTLAISEIAFLLGFSEPSAFHRAFKRWTSQAPRAFRELALPGNPVG